MHLSGSLPAFLTQRNINQAEQQSPLFVVENQVHAECEEWAPRRAAIGVAAVEQIPGTEFAL
jgi:hypothetical protein